MSRLNESDYAEVLGAGFAHHATPFYTNQKEGLPCYLFRLQTEGSCHALIDGTLSPVKPGDLLLYKPGDPYELSIGPDKDKYRIVLSSSDYYIFGRGPWLDRWWQERPKPQITNIPDESVLKLFQHIVFEKRRGKAGETQISDYLLRSLCLTIDRSIREASSQKSPGTSFVAYQMKHYIEQNAVLSFTLEDVANHVGLSVSRAVHLFKSTFDQTIMEYAIDVRLSMACERIRFSSMTLEQAAQAAGFRSYSYFHRAFRSRYGISPKQFRMEGFTTQ